MNDKIVILIPAYNPTVDLITLVKNLKENLYSHIIIVNDGSSLSCKSLFDAISSNCVVINHEKNLGKGCALKTGFKYIERNYNNISTIITVDADGQHLISDINKVKNLAISKPNNFVLGCREFKKSKIPFRNRLGNALMSLIFHLVYKVNIPDTQTGLRAFPVSSVSKLLTIRGFRYEYEQNMLIYFVKNFRSNISCVNIAAVYKQKQVSYFKVFKDSVSIVKCLFLKSN